MKKIFVFIRLCIVMGIIMGLLLFAISQFAIPDMGLIYSVKRAGEKAILYTKFDPEAKANYYGQLADTRLSEFNEVLDNGNVKEKMMYDVSLRYSSTLGEYLQFLIDNNLDEKIRLLDKDMEEHKKIMQELLVRYSDASVEDEKKWIEDAINYIDLYQTKISQLQIDN